MDYTTPLPNGDDLHRVPGMRTQRLKLVLTDSRAALTPTPDPINSQPSEDYNSPPEVGRHRNDGKLENSRNYETRAASRAKVAGTKRKSDALDDINSSLSGITDHAEFNTGDTAAVSEREPPRKSRLVKVVARSEKCHQSAQDDKPDPFGTPPVWAEKRQNMCETLPYYRAYMSGAYQDQGVVRAFMIDKEVGGRDKFNEEIIISRAGGGRTADLKTGKMVQTKDQNVNSISLAFQRSKDEQIPVVMIAGHRNDNCPSNLPHYYNVLDWFHVTDVWCEKYEGVKCWMVRLEKINLTTRAWWAPKNSPLPDPGRDIHEFKTTSQCCNLCNTSSKLIYNQGWTCLDTSCLGYFKFTPDVNDKLLEYNEAFMKERTIFDFVELPPLAPEPVSILNAVKRLSSGYEAEFKRGIVCPLCKGCIRRIEWSRWICETPGCDFTHRVPQDIISLNDAIGSQVLEKSQDYYNEDFGIRRRQMTMGMYDVVDFIFPGPAKGEVAGIIRHFKADGAINSQPSGPNHLFRQMQYHDLNLKRHAARGKDNTTETLTSHYASNWGAPYKFGVTVQSKGFDEAPSVIIEALKRLTWAGEKTVTGDAEPFHAFNELLSIGYFEDCNIGYHDDGEKELGPTVATLSLGANAVMSLRPKRNCGLGPVSKNAKGTKPDILRFKISHGDMVIMHGSGIQRYYEHAVKPTGILRFALTCRYVRPEMMANDEERRQAEIKGRLPDGHERFSYHGDTKALLLPPDKGGELLAELEATLVRVAASAQAGEVGLNMLRATMEVIKNEIEKGMR